MAKIEVGIDRSMLDPARQNEMLAVHNADPSKKYRWIIDNDLSLRRRIEGQGWEFEHSKPGSGKLTVGTDPRMPRRSVPDDSIHVGDLVLVSMPKERFAKRFTAPVEELNRRRMQTVSAQLHNDARRVGVRSYEEHHENSSMKTWSDPDKE